MKKTISSYIPIVSTRYGFLRIIVRIRDVMNSITSRIFNSTIKKYTSSINNTLKNPEGY